MNEELSKELFNINPAWFNRHDMKNNLLCFGFACGDGWYPLIKGLLGLAKNKENNWKQLKNLVTEWRAENNKHALEASSWWRADFNEEFNPFDDVHLQVIQVKEKFGELRFYYSGGDNDFHGAVELAEFVSRYMCEGCGTRSEIRNRGGYYTTLCDTCYEKRFYRFEKG